MKTLRFLPSQLAKDKFLYFGKFLNDNFHILILTQKIPLTGVMSMSNPL